MIFNLTFQCFSEWSKLIIIAVCCNCCLLKGKYFVTSFLIYFHWLNLLWSVHIRLCTTGSHDLLYYNCILTKIVAVLVYAWLSLQKNFLYLKFINHHKISFQMVPLAKTADQRWSGEEVLKANVSSQEPENTLRYASLFYKPCWYMQG